MYYDTLLSALPVFLLFTEPGRWFQPRFVTILFPSPEQLKDSVTGYYRPWPVPDYPEAGSTLLVRTSRVGVLNSFVMTLLAFMAVAEYVFPALGLDVIVSTGSPATGSEAAGPVFKLSTRINGTPWHTFSLIALWLWCGWQVLWRNPR
jgi:hypothetical protein